MIGWQLLGPSKTGLMFWRSLIIGGWEESGDLDQKQDVVDDRQFESEVCDQKPVNVPLVTRSSYVFMVAFTLETGCTAEGQHGKIFFFFRMYSCVSTLLFSYTSVVPVLWIGVISRSHLISVWDETVRIIHSKQCVCMCIVRTLRYLNTNCCFPTCIYLDVSMFCYLRVRKRGQNSIIVRKMVKTRNHSP